MFCSIKYIHLFFFSRTAYAVSIPMAKDSPFFSSFKRALDLIKERGHIEKLRSIYSLKLDENGECDPAVIQLGFQQTFLPFACLIFGTMFAIVVCFIEGVLFSKSLHYQKKQMELTTTNEENIKRSVQAEIHQKLKVMSLQSLCQLKEQL